MKEENTKRAVCLWKHQWVSDGFKQWGYHTEHFEKCKQCGSVWSSFDWNKRPSNIAGFSVGLILVIPVIILITLAELYVKGII